MEISKSDQQRFAFQPRWKEQLIVSQPAGSFLLDMPMGRERPHFRLLDKLKLFRTNR